MKLKMIDSYEFVNRSQAMQKQNGGQKWNNNIEIV